MKTTERSLFWIERDNLEDLLQRVRAEPGSTVGAESVQPQQAEPPPPAFEVPTGEPPERLQGLVDWLEAAREGLSACVTDAEGVSLAGEYASDQLAVSAAGLGRAWHAAREQLQQSKGGMVTAELAAVEVLHLWAVPGAEGLLILGVSSPVYLSREWTKSIANAFRDSI